jgi:2-succinyl-5-enolpyruvyl-6-hydroxy-3-cyclohexene-1-carboxylate synthase
MWSICCPIMQCHRASSLPVRHLDQFGRPNTKSLRVFANRGASGIDGTISSALGAAASRPNLPLTLVTGDLAFYHDMNGLMAIKRLGIKATIVVINNDGGGIFHRLPIAIMITVHRPVRDATRTKFRACGTVYGLDYIRADDLMSFRQRSRQSPIAEFDYHRSADGRRTRSCAQCDCEPGCRANEDHRQM